MPGNPAIDSSRTVLGFAVRADRADRADRIGVPLAATPRGGQTEGRAHTHPSRWDPAEDGWIDSFGMASRGISKPPGTERPSPSMASSLLGCNATAGSERALVPAPPPPSGSLHLHSIAHLCWCGRARSPVSGAASGQPSLSARCTQRALALYPSFSPPIPPLSLSPRLLRVPSPWPSSLPRLRDSLAPRALARPVSLARLPAPPAGLPAPPPPCCPRPVTNDALGELGRVAAAQSAPASKGRGVWLIWRAELAVGM